jgi:carboxymethylenebutenolidase
MFPDAGGLRDVFRGMGDRMASLGYVTLVPDVYYREGDWAPFDLATAFGDEKERARLFAIMGTLTNERVIADASAYVDFLLGRPEVAGSMIGTTGYCMGGGRGRKRGQESRDRIGPRRPDRRRRRPLVPAPGGGPHRRHRLRGRRG